MAFKAPGILALVASEAMGLERVVFRKVCGYAALYIFLEGVLGSSTKLAQPLPLGCFGSAYGNECRSLTPYVFRRVSLYFVLM